MSEIAQFSLTLSLSLSRETIERLLPVSAEPLPLNSHLDLPKTFESPKFLTRIFITDLFEAGQKVCFTKTSILLQLTI